MGTAERSATDGVFNGIVKATDFQLPSGDTMVSILNSSKDKIVADYLDLMGINIKNDAGQTVMTIDQTGVKFGTGFSPVTYQYSVDGTSWHNTMSANDKYRRESYDGGGTWEPGYQFRGTDGKNGSNANVTFDSIKSALQKAASTQTSFITADEVGAPTIYGGKIYGAQMYANEFNVHPLDETDYTGSFKIYGMFDGKQKDMFEISYNGEGDYPKIDLRSYADSSIYIGRDNAIYFEDSTVYFSKAKKIYWGSNAPVAVFG